MSDGCLQKLRGWGRQSPIPARWTLSILGLFGVNFVYSLRINMSMAIVCMVNTTTANDTDDKGYDGDLNWSNSLQGHILSSYFYGYMSTQVFGGMLADRIGGKHIYGYGLLTTFIATLLIPVCANASPYLLIAIRVLIGMGAGVSFPAINALWAKWAPPMERSKLMTFASSGAMVGNIITLSVSGLLCSTDIGWPLIFYIFGCAGLVWYICWRLFIYNSPSVHPFIKERERNYITSALAVTAPKGERPPVPWISIFTSPPFWAILVAHVCYNWGNYMLLTSLPKYMAKVLEYDIKSNGLLSALPYLVQLVSVIIGGFVADAIRKNKILSTTATRKVYQVSGFIGQGVFMVATGFIEKEQRTIAVVMLALSAAFTYGSRSGYFINHVDIAPRYAGVIYGITNTVATVPGIVAPIVVAELTPNGLREEWQKVFYITGAIYAVGSIVYGLFGSGEEQEWARREIKSDSLDNKIENGSCDNFKLKSERL